MAWSPSPHSIFLCLSPYFIFLKSASSLLPIRLGPDSLRNRSTVNFSPFFCIWIIPKQSVRFAPASLLHYILLFLPSFVFYLFLVRHWLLPLIADSTSFIMCHSTLKILSWLEGIFQRGSMEYIFCRWIWVCAIKMTLYKLSGMLQSIVIVEKIEEKITGKLNKSLWALFCSVSRVYR